MCQNKKKNKLPYCAHFGAGRVPRLNIDWEEFLSKDSID